MADEIEVSGSLRLQRDGIDVMLSQLGRQFDQSGSKYVEIIQEIGTSEEALDKGDITTPGLCLAVNLDPTNFISIRAGTGLGNAIRLDANYGFALFKFGSGATAPFAIADTSACKLKMLLLEA
jgi:hypothetical protein